MAMMPNFHIPVMLREALEYLNPQDGKTIVDCTLGGGGHAEGILKTLTPNPSPRGRGETENTAQDTPSPHGRGGQGVRVIALDQDEEALHAAIPLLSIYQGIQFIHENFGNIDKIITKPVDGFLFDLGVSSYQIDEASRGFSFRKDAPLDMRMDKGLKVTAADLVNSLSQQDLEKIFFEYGEERFSKRIVRKIQETRNKEQINSTFQLKKIIEEAIPTWKKRESVARIFQALRIEVNHELENLEKGLKSAVERLNVGGRIVVISYHSLEDRIVKKFFKESEKNGILKVLTKKPIMAAEEEVKANSRAKSAKLRCAQKK